MKTNKCVWVYFPEFRRSYGDQDARYSMDAGTRSAAAALGTFQRRRQTSSAVGLVSAQSKPGLVRRSLSTGPLR